MATIAGLRGSKMASTTATVTSAMAFPLASSTCSTCFPHIVAHKDRVLFHNVARLTRVEPRRLPTVGTHQDRHATSLPKRLALVHYPAIRTTLTPPMLRKFSLRTRSMPIFMVVVDEGQLPHAPCNANFTCGIHRVEDNNVLSTLDRIPAEPVEVIRQVCHHFIIITSS